MRSIKFYGLMLLITYAWIITCYHLANPYIPPAIMVVHAKEQPKDVSVKVDLTKIPKGKILDVIAQCESSNDYGAQAKGSSAFGRYQIVKGTFAMANKALGGRLSIINPRDQDLAAMWLLETRGLRDWEASRGCWSKIIGNNPNY